ncbi:hypothetical protein [Phyllobacterium sp. 22552]|uniref:hypothetical protein n=1 Tax=Phyllobacterium sp. 22552 TaxID=3453941 RepID=UPI003F87D0FE
MIDHFPSGSEATLTKRLSTAVNLSILADLKDIGFAPMQGQKMAQQSTKPNWSAEKQRRNWLAIMAAVSIGYILVLGVLFHLVTPKPYDCAYGYFPCLSANELGDLVAGVFAPLAFLWLVAAVLVQSQELQEQRKELALTREEMKLQRGEFEQSRLVAIESKGVAEAQAKAADAQAQAAILNANAAEVQNTILHEQLLAQRQERTDQHIVSLISELHSMFSYRLADHLFLSKELGPSSIHTIDVLLWTNTRTSDPISALLGILPHANLQMKKINDLNEGYKFDPGPQYSDLKRTLTILSSIIELSASASPRKKQLIADLDVIPVRDQLHLLMH